MAFRFRKSIRIAPGIRLNFSRSGVSTTLGGRGLSVNLGRRGTRVTTGLAGTGLSYSARAGSPGRGGAAGRSDAGAGEPGCLGCGTAGFFLLLFMGFCAGLDDPPSGTPYAAAADTIAVAPHTAYSPSEPREAFYIHGPINVRSSAAKDAEKVRTLGRGERVQLGAKDPRGWAPLFDGYGQRVGYVYRASDNVRSYPPRAAAAAASVRRRPARTHPAGASAICRDGTYSYSANRRGTCSWHGGVRQWL